MAHTAYLFANTRANRMKVLVHDGIGFWLAARRLHQGHFIWPNSAAQTQLTLTRPQLDALVLGLPWSRIGEGGIITVVESKFGEKKQLKIQEKNLLSAGR